MSFKKISQLLIEDINKIVNINYLNNIHLLNILLSYTKQNSVIINISSSSIFGSRDNQQIYSSSKIAFHNYIEGLRLEYIDHMFYNIVPRRCNTLSRRSYINENNMVDDYLNVDDVSESIINVLLGLNNKLTSGCQINLI